MSINTKNLMLKQAFTLSLLESLGEDIKTVETECEKTIEEVFQKFDLYEYVVPTVQIRIGFMNKNWFPHFLITNIAPKEKSRGFSLSKEPVFVKISDSWLAVNRNVAHCSTINLKEIDFTKKLDYVDLVKLKEACNELTEKTGFPVKINEHSINNIPKNTSTLLEIHGGGTIVCSGEKHNEPWAVLRTKKSNYIVYYSTNGNGLGYDKCLKPEQSKNEFFVWLGNETEVKSVIPAKILGKLKENS